MKEYSTPFVSVAHFALVVLIPICVRFVPGIDAWIFATASLPEKIREAKAADAVNTSARARTLNDCFIKPLSNNNLRTAGIVQENRHAVTKKNLSAP